MPDTEQVISQLDSSKKAFEMSVRFFVYQVAFSSVSNLVATLMFHPLDTIKVSLTLALSHFFITSAHSTFVAKTYFLVFSNYLILMLNPLFFSIGTNAAWAGSGIFITDGSRDTPRRGHAWIIQRPDGARARSDPLLHSRLHCKWSHQEGARESLRDERLGQELYLGLNRWWCIARRLQPLRTTESEGSSEPSWQYQIQRENSRTDTWRGLCRPLQRLRSPITSWCTGLGRLLLVLRVFKDLNGDSWGQEKWNPELGVERGN